MISFKEEKTKREIIMKHYSNPENKVAELPQWENVKISSQNCVDNMEMAFEIDENHIIQNAKFKGEGCAIFLASTDIFLSKIKNKNISKAIELADEYKKLVNQEIKDSVQLEELNVFHNVKTHLNRLECASLVTKGFCEKFKK